MHGYFFEKSRSYRFWRLVKYVVAVSLLKEFFVIVILLVVVSIIKPITISHFISLISAKKATHCSVKILESTRQSDLKKDFVFSKLLYFMRWRLLGCELLIKNISNALNNALMPWCLNSKRGYLWNQQKYFLFHFKSAFRSCKNQSLEI